MALSGQQYDAQTRPRHLHFAPHRDLLGKTFWNTISAQDGSAGSVEWPVLLPHVTALLKLRATGDRNFCSAIRVISGTLDLDTANTKLTMALPTASPVTHVFSHFMVGSKRKLQKDETAEMCTQGSIDATGMVV